MSPSGAARRRSGSSRSARAIISYRMTRRLVAERGLAQAVRAPAASIEHAEAVAREHSDSVIRTAVTYRRRTLSEHPVQYLFDPRRRRASHRAPSLLPTPWCAANTASPGPIAPRCGMAVGQRCSRTAERLPVAFARRAGSRSASASRSENTWPAASLRS